MQLYRDDFEQGLTTWLNENVAEKESTAVVRHIDPKQWQAKREVRRPELLYMGELSSDTCHPSPSQVISGLNALIRS